MHIGPLLVALVVVVGCVTPGAVPCGDRTCPADTVCYVQPATETPMCLSRGQDEACRVDGVADGEPCSGNGFTGICENQRCIPGCGDGAINRADETCDDGNFRSHDGCASSCVVETLTWEQMPDPWTGMFQHVAGYHPGGSPQTSMHNGFFVLLTGQDQTGVRTQQFLSRDVLNWIDEQKPLPSPRKGAAMTYDAARNKLVLFGGRGTTALADTWEWDFVTGWVERTDLGASPPAREDAQLVYDVTHQRSVLFGGFGATDLLDDTWEYDGTTWTNRSSATRPLARVGHAMAYDPSRDRVVLYGGKYLLATLGDQWEYDNGTWTSVSFGTNPGPRSDAVMGYNAARKIVLFGGFSESAGEAILANDTWQFSGSAWTRIESLVAPPARASATLVAGPPPGPYPGAPPPFELYLVGGEQSDGKPVLNDQWRLTATGWVEMSPRLLPASRQGSPAVYVDRTQAIHVFGGIGSSIRDDVWSYVGESWAQPNKVTFAPRAFHAAGYDPQRDRVVMFGGLEAAGISDDTFETAADNEFTWTPANPSVRPPARLGGVLAWDGGTLVLFGGTIANARADDTWTYDGTTWTQEPKQGAWPSASSQAAAAYDYVHQRLVMFDHDGATWTHANGTWTKLVDAGAVPPARDDAALTFDWQTQRLVLVGGRASPTDLQADVWELDDTTWRELDVAGAGPLPRALFGLSSTPYSHDTLLIGGTSTGGQPGSDVWRLTYRARDAIEETCGNGIDDDGDKQADNNDPDCCAFAAPMTCI